MASNYPDGIMNWDFLNFNAEMCLEELHSLWETFQEIPLNKKNEITEKFMDFEIGANRDDIWVWFEDQNDQFNIGLLI